LPCTFSGANIFHKLYNRFSENEKRKINAIFAIYIEQKLGSNIIDVVLLSVGILKSTERHEVHVSPSTTTVNVTEVSI
jgi:hypothetical protein